MGVGFETMAGVFYPCYRDDSAIKLIQPIKLWFYPCYRDDSVTKSNFLCGYVFYPCNRDDSAADVLSSLQLIFYPCYRDDSGRIRSSNFVH